MRNPSGTNENYVAMLHGSGQGFPVVDEIKSTTNSVTDLEEFGSRFEQQDVPPVVPVVNLLLSMRMIVKDTLGINLTGGWNTGFYFGGSIQYFFGQGGKNKPKEREDGLEAEGLEAEPVARTPKRRTPTLRATNYTPYSSF